MTTKEANRAAVKRHYENNKQYYFDKSKRAKEEKLAYIIKLRENTPCMDCKISYPYYVMEFDHRPEHLKVGNVTTLIGNSWNKLLTEIDKCDIVCANCHSIRTWQRKNGPLA